MLADERHRALSLAPAVTLERTAETKVALVPPLLIKLTLSALHSLGSSRLLSATMQNNLENNLDTQDARTTWTPKMQNNLDTQKTRKNLIAIWTPKKPGKIVVP